MHLHLNLMYVWLRFIWQINILVFARLHANGKHGDFFGSEDNEFARHTMDGQPVYILSTRSIGRSYRQMDRIPHLTTTLAVVQSYPHSVEVSGVARNFTWEGLRLPSLPLPFLLSPLPSFFLPFFPLPSSVLPFFCYTSLLFLEVKLPKIQLSGLRRCELPQRGPGRSPSRNRIWCILALKARSGGNNFIYFAENKLTKLVNLVQYKRAVC